MNHQIRLVPETVTSNIVVYFFRFLWFMCVNVGTVATLVIIVSLWEKFQTNPTITGLDTDFHKWDVPFPAITICEDVPSNITAIENYVEELRLMFVICLLLFNVMLLYILCDFELEFDCVCVIIFQICLVCL